jgi:hypothetical protein
MVMAAFLQATSYLLNQAILLVTGSSMSIVLMRYIMARQYAPSFRVEVMSITVSLPNFDVLSLFRSTPSKKMDPARVLAAAAYRIVSGSDLLGLSQTNTLCNFPVLFLTLQFSNARIALGWP